MAPKRQQATILLPEDVVKRKSVGWYTDDVIALSKRYKTKSLKMRNVKHWVYSTPWSIPTGNTQCPLSIYEVITLPKDKTLKEHHKRIKKADTSYPLIITPDPYDKYGIILDGNHRFAKLVNQDAEFVDVVSIPLEALNKIKVDLDKE